MRVEDQIVRLTKLPYYVWVRSRNQ
jgi:hypothetical protein